VVQLNQTIEKLKQTDYVKSFVKNGFTLVDRNEPIPTEEQSKMSSRVAWLKNSDVLIHRIEKISFSFDDMSKYWVATRAKLTLHHV
jgi:hypothetical protein